MKHRTAGVAALVIAIGVALAGCTINIGSPDEDAGSGMPRDGIRGDGMMGDSDSGDFSGADLMFAQMMIPHHQQAVDMSELAIEKTADPDVRELAEQIRDAQAPEIEQMESWLDEAGTFMRMGPDMGMRMGGMLSEAEMNALEDATGPEFDRLFLEGMIEHHEGAILMTQMILDSANPEVRALGEAIVESQTAEIERMKELLDEGP